MMRCRIFPRWRLEPYLRPPIALLVLSLAVGAGCGRTPVRTAPVMPDLEVPPPPPRTVEPLDAQVPAPVPLVDAPVRTVERPRTPAPPPPRDLKPEPKSEPALEAKPPDDTRPAATLQTAPTDREAEVERRVRSVLQTATAQLNRIDYRRLNPDVQLQYDTAKRFVLQAEEALQARNFVFAATMADKAATLASQLTGR
jgi:hypothetical protein